MQIDLRRLSFGAPAAERDVDVGLYTYFVESENYQRLLRRDQTIVIGNRGAGKSALFKILAQRLRSAGATVIELSPENYSYELLSTALKREKEGAWAKQGAFAAAWKYLIYVLVMKGLTDEGPRLKTGAAGKIYSYLRDNHKGFQENPSAVLVSYLKRIEGLKIGSYEAAIRAKELTRLYRLEELEDLLPALIELLDRRKVIVLVDELDKGWDGSEDAKAFVSGLFQAAVSINQHTKRLTVYISLRQELYDSIPALYDDAQKYRDIIQTIRWDEESLLKLVANRIRYSVPELIGRSDLECWNSVFVETLTYRKAKSFNYVIDRTLYRPREVIQFCTDALEESRDSSIFPIDYSVLSQAELIYSDGRAKDIAAEYRFQYPGLQSVFGVFRGLVWTLERTELEDLCWRLTTGDVGVDKTAAWLANQDAELLIEVLWQIGFLRALAVGGLKAVRRSGSSYVGPHQVSTLNFQAVKRFQVHPMFRAFLGMKEPRKENIDTAEE